MNGNDTRNVVRLRFADGGAHASCIVSTGIAPERVTEWLPNRKLAFVVVRDVPAMRELSPYAQVHAPRRTRRVSVRQLDIAQAA